VCGCIWFVHGVVDGLLCTDAAAHLPNIGDWIPVWCNRKGDRGLETAVFTVRYNRGCVMLDIDLVFGVWLPAPLSTYDALGLEVSHAPGPAPRHHEPPPDPLPVAQCEPRAPPPPLSASSPEFIPSSPPPTPQPPPPKSTPPPPHCQIPTHLVHIKAVAPWTHRRPRWTLDFMAFHMSNAAAGVPFLVHLADAFAHPGVSARIWWKYRLKHQFLVDSPLCTFEVRNGMEAPPNVHVSDSISGAIGVVPAQTQIVFVFPSMIAAHSIHAILAARLGGDRVKLFGFGPGQGFAKTVEEHVLGGDENIAVYVSCVCVCVVVVVWPCVCPPTSHPRAPLDQSGLGPQPHPPTAQGPGSHPPDPTPWCQNGLHPHCHISRWDGNATV
jgi:hypothetical protein